MTPLVRYSLYVLGSAIMAGASWILTETAISFYGVAPLLTALLSDLVGGSFLLLLLRKKSRKTPSPRWQQSDWVRILL
ncbi:MAG: hypothetical protein AAF485_18690, partial [Chloroflexota bacterium]